MRIDERVKGDGVGQELVFVECQHSKRRERICQKGKGKGSVTVWEGRLGLRQSNSQVLFAYLYIYLSWFNGTPAVRIPYDIRVTV